MNNIFRDEYTDFTFNGVQSSQMKVWITNSRDLQFRLTPEFSDTFITPSFSNTQILNSTNITKSTFSLKCIAINITMQDWRAIQTWLSPTAVGRLSFDFNIGTYYNAKIDKGIAGTAFIRGGDYNISDRYIIEFTVGFTTVGDYAALGEVNVGILGKEFNSRDEEADEKYYIESVSNNRYFIPSISKIDNTNPVKDTVVKIGNRGIEVTYSTNVSGVIQLAYIYDLSIKDSSNCFREIYTIQYNGTREKIEVLRWKYDDNFNKSRTILNSFEKTEILTFFGEELYLLMLQENALAWSDQISPYAICNSGSYDMYPSFLLNCKEFVINKNNECVYDYNLKIPATSTLDGKNGFVLSQGQPIENVSYKVLFNDTTYEYPLVDTHENNGILNIESGRPQLFKARYIDSLDAKWYKNKKPSDDVDNKKYYLYREDECRLVEEEKEYTVEQLKKDDETLDENDYSKYIKKGIFSSQENGEFTIRLKVDEVETIYTIKVDDFDDSQQTGKVYTFISPEKLNYDHRGNVAIHIFKDVVGMQPFNTSKYPLFSLQNYNNYDMQFIQSNFILDGYIEYTEKNGYYEYSILSPNKDLDLISNFTYYISICNYDVLDITTVNNGDVQFDSFIYLQTRDAF